jgi:hypothetical protein
MLFQDFNTRTPVYNDLIPRLMSIFAPHGGSRDQDPCHLRTRHSVLNSLVPKPPEPQLGTPRVYTTC